MQCLQQVRRVCLDIMMHVQEKLVKVALNLCVKQQHNSIILKSQKAFVSKYLEQTHEVGCI